MSLGPELGVSGLMLLSRISTQAMMVRFFTSPYGRTSVVTTSTIREIT